MCSLSKIAMKSAAVVFQEVSYVSLGFDVLRRDVEHILEDTSCALRFGVGLQVAYLYVVRLSFHSSLGYGRVHSE